MMKNKRGWLRIVEAVFGIMIIAGVALATYSNSTERPDLEDYVYELQTEVLSKIASENLLRTEILKNETDRNMNLLNDTVDGELPDNFGFKLQVCDIAVPCPLEDVEGEVFSKSIFAEERIISSVIGSPSYYGPKKVKLFVWEKG
jgi:hypothetical protein